jgi:hypothetical protein
MFQVMEGLVREHMEELQRQAERARVRGRARTRSRRRGRVDRESGAAAVAPRVAGHAPVPGTPRPS